ncbi:MAG: molybdopterin-guanine dinucleotide biosynthesis protein B [bacterium]
MRAIGIVGFKESGKTTLAVNLSQELKRRGYTVTTIKHSDKSLTLAGTDSAKLIECTGQGAAVTEAETALYFTGPKQLEEVLKYFEADFAVIEGFKNERTYPKIVCLRDETEAKSLFDGLQICAVGSGEDLAVPLLKDVREIADLVLRRAFKLPKLDCGGCDFDTCYELAQAIVAGNRTEEDCVALRPKTVVKIDGQTVPLNPFASNMIRNTIIGILSSLKGVRKGSIEIAFSP